VQRNDRLRVLVIDNTWIQLSSLEYLFLLPLLQNFGQYVSSATLLQAVYGSSYEPREARRLAKLVYRLRSKLAPHDLTIETVIGTSYQARGYILQRIPPTTAASSTWRTIQPSSPC
jgi:DNA-binding response OmpR family regulator